MKHSDQKKLTSMVCAGVLSVSSFFGCAYGPDPTESLREDYSLELSQMPDSGDAAAIPEAESIRNT